MIIRSKYIAALLVALVVGGAGLMLYTAQSGAATAPLTPARTAASPTQATPPARPATEAFDVAQAAAPLPGGASALNETYQDWLVTCAMRDQVKRCAISQSQVQQNGQRVLAIELNAPAADGVEGILVLPFGLALDSGARLAIDDTPVQPALHFRTCLPAGCIVPMTLDLATLDALKSGAVLKVSAVADGGQEQAFSISLNGFAAAIDRLSALVN